MKRWTVVLAVLVGLVLAAPLRGRAAELVTLRLGHVGAPGSLFDLAATEFARRVNSELKGKVEVKVFGASELGSDEQMLKGIRTGTPEMFLPATIMSTVDAKFGVFEMPYLIVSREHMKRVVQHKGVQEVLLGSLPSKGLRVLGVWELGFRHITNNVRPIVKPADLKGIRLRVPSGVWRLRMFQEYGASPTAMPLNEVYAALQSGTMDGQENPLTQTHSAKFQEVQKYLSLSGHVYTPAYLVIGEDVWKRLPSGVQTAMTRAAREVGDYARAEGARLDKELLGKMAQATKVNEVDKDAFIKASAAVYDAFGTEVAGGATLIRAIQALR